MQIHISSDASIAQHESFTTRITAVIEAALSHCSHRITRVDVHMSDENGAKKGHDDKRCTLEAHVEGLAPSAVTHHAETLDKAVHGAADRLKRMLESTIDKLRHQG